MGKRFYPLIMAVFIAGLLCGGFINGSLAEPVIVTYDNMTFELEAGQDLELIPKEQQVRIVRVEVPVYRTIEQPVPVIKEVIKWRNIYDREWESVAQFKEWYQAQDFKPLFPSSDYKVDCDDYAERLQIYALRQGYPVSIALTKDGYYYGVKVTEENHAFNLVMINGVYYGVEGPRIFKIVERD